jgi:hypothetical protein
MNLEHERMEMYTPFVFHTHIRKEQVHQKGLSTTCESEQESRWSNEHLTKPNIKTNKKIARMTHRQIHTNTILSVEHVPPVNVKTQTARLA